MRLKTILTLSLIFGLLGTPIAASAVPITQNINIPDPDPFIGTFSGWKDVGDDFIYAHRHTTLVLAEDNTGRIEISWHTAHDSPAYKQVSRSIGWEHSSYVGIICKVFDGDKQIGTLNGIFAGYSLHVHGDLEGDPIDEYLARTADSVSSRGSSQK